MKNFNELVPLNKMDVDAGELKKENLEPSIYSKLFSEAISKYLYTGEGAQNYSILDMFCTRSSVFDCVKDLGNIKYVGLESVLEYNQDRNNHRKPDIVCDINKVPLSEKTCDIIFSRADRLGYGKNHYSLFEVERIIRPNGYLVISASRFWYNIGFNQMLFCYRDWQYIEAVEIAYNFQDVKDDKPIHIQTSKFFLIYKKYGK